MKLTDDVYLVGSGRNGIWLTNDYDSHVYLIDGGSELALIDSGAGIEGERILANIAKDGHDPKRIRYVLLTHCHADHWGGVSAMKRATGARVAISEREADFLRRGDEDSIGLTIARREGYYPSSYHIQPVEVDLPLRDSQMISVGNLQITAINVPGHSIGSICYLVRGKGGTYLFSGDVVFHKGLIGLLNCPGSSLEDYRNNIGKLKGLNVDALFPGHQTFCLSNGQWHINQAIEAFKGLIAPKNAIG